MMQARKITREDGQRMVRLAWPALAENLLATLVQFIDTAMVGALGATATAAVAVAVNATPIWLLNGIVTSVGVGGTALVARMIGAKDREGAEAAARQVFLAAVALAVTLFAATMIVAPYVPRWMRAEPVLHADATAYLRLVGLAFIPHYTGMALGSVLRGAGDTRTPMWIAAAANVLNVLGNFLLIYETRTLQLFGLSLPVWGAGMGVRGAAISTAVSTGLAGLWMVWAITRPKSRLRLSLHRLRPNADLLRRIFRVGFPAALERVTINVGQLFFVGMIAAIGTAQLAAHHLAVTVESLSYMPGFAFGVAATTLVGQSLGATDVPAAKAQGRLTIGIGVVVMTLIGVGLFAFAHCLIAMLTPDGTVREIGTVLIRICALEQPFMALSMVGSGALRGAGDTRVPFVISLIGMWGVRLVLARWFVYGLGWGVNGAWYAMVLDVAVRGTLMGARFARGKWAYLRV